MRYLSALSIAAAMASGCSPSAAPSDRLLEETSSPGDHREQVCVFNPYGEGAVSPSFALADDPVTEDAFNLRIDEVEQEFGPVLEAMGERLEIKRFWSDDTRNAYASRSIPIATPEGMTRPVWEVLMYGGLARVPAMTPDGFTAVLCHEVGHHLAGYPFKGARWAAAEGQSDYYATKDCLPRLWRDDLEVNAAAAASVDPVAKEKCDSAYESGADVDLCYRISLASQSLANTLASLNNGDLPSFATPDESKVIYGTNINHPKAQCRLDTYLSGALCKVKQNAGVIPGVFDYTKSLQEIEVAATEFACAESETGARPGCWFLPTLTYGRDLVDVVIVPTSSNPALPQELAVTIRNHAQALAGAKLTLLDGTDVSSLDDQPRSVPFTPANTSVSVTGMKVAVDPSVTCGQRVAPLFRLETVEGSSLLSADGRLGRFKRIASGSGLGAVEGMDVAFAAETQINTARVLIKLRGPAINYQSDLKFSVELQGAVAGAKVVIPLTKKLIDGTSLGESLVLAADLPVAMKLSGSSRWLLSAKQSGSSTPDLATYAQKVDSWRIEFGNYECTPITPQ